MKISGWRMPISGRRTERRWVLFNYFYFVPIFMRVPLSIFISITILNACACFSLYLCTIFSYFVNKFFYYDARLEATIATIDLEASF